MLPVTLLSVSFIHLLCLVSCDISAKHAVTGAHDGINDVVLQIPEIEIDDCAIRNGLSDSMKQSLDLIDKVKTLPSCAKIASSALLHSCSALEGSIEHDGQGMQRGSDLFVEEEADIYAARLAVCELSGARFVIPTECRSFIPTKAMKKARGIRGFWSRSDVSESRAFFQYYADITEKHLQDCRQALGSTPQAWTSYSNSRQNAVVMCHAMRSQIEKDEQLRVGRILSNTAAASAESLQDALRQAVLFKEQFHDLTEAMPSFQLQLAEDNENLHTMLLQWWNDVGQLREGLKDADRDIDELRLNIRQASEEASDLASNAISAATSALDIKKAVSATYEDVGELAQLVDYALTTKMQELAKAMFNASQDMSLMNSMMPQLQERVDDLLKASADARDELLNNRKEQQISHEETLATIERLKNEAEDMGKQIFRKALCGVQAYLREIWTGAAIVAVKFACICAVSTLLGFGAWERWIGFSFFGNLCGAFASSIVLATIVTLWSDSLSLVRPFMSTSIGSASGFNAFLALSCCSAVVMATLRRSRGRPRRPALAEYSTTASSPAYDPAGAPYLNYVPNANTNFARGSNAWLLSRSEVDRCDS